MSSRTKDDGQGPGWRLGKMRPRPGRLDGLKGPCLPYPPTRLRADRGPRALGKPGRAEPKGQGEDSGQEDRMTERHQRPRAGYSDATSADQKSEASEPPASPSQSNDGRSEERSVGKEWVST